MNATKQDRIYFPPVIWLLVVVVACIGILVFAAFDEQHQTELGKQKCDSICKGQGLAFDGFRLGTPRRNGVCYCTDADSNLHALLLD
jgi:hypothetical protein